MGTFVSSTCLSVYTVTELLKWLHLHFLPHLTEMNETQKATGFYLWSPDRKVLDGKKGHHLITIPQYQTVVQPLRSPQMVRIRTSCPPCPHTQPLLLAQEIRNQTRTHTRLVALFFPVNKEWATFLPRPLGLCPFYYLNSFPTFYFSINLYLIRWRWMLAWLYICYHIKWFPPNSM